MGALTALFAVALLLMPASASGEENSSVLREKRPVQGYTTLLNMGVQAMERLPWDKQVLRFSLSSERPVAIEATYLMDEHLLIVSHTGMVYAVSRNNPAPRWVAGLKHPLAKPPAEGPTHYAFLTKDHRGSYWIETFRKSNGQPGNRFPKRVGFAALGGLDLNGSSVFISSLGSPRDNRTLETINLVTGRSAWGYRTTGLVWGSPVVTENNDAVILAAEDGVVSSVPASATPPQGRNWGRQLSGAITGGIALTAEHALVGTHDGLFYCLDVLSGEVKWMKSVGGKVKMTPWFLGSTVTRQVASEIEGANPIEIRRFEGLAFARNGSGTHAFDIQTGKLLFTCPAGARPISKNGKWLVTHDTNARELHLRDASDGYKVKARLDAKMFALIPRNTSGTEIYGVTHDGGVVSVLPPK